MIQISLVIFRELLEIMLLISLISAALAQKVSNFRHYLITGAIVGITGAVILAKLTPTISELFSGQGQEIFNSTIICITALMLTYTVMAMKSYSLQLKSEVGNLAERANNGLVYKLSLVGIIAINFFREGSEIVLFLYSVMISGLFPWHTYAAGILLGGLAASLCGLILYKGLLRISFIFNVTSLMLTLVIANLAAEAGGILGRCDIIPFGNSYAWDTSWLIDDKSGLGQILRSLIGYHSKPSILEVAIFTITFSIIYYYSTLKNHTIKK